MTSMRIALIGAASGTITGLCLTALGGHLPAPLYLVPGIVFGLIFAVILYRRNLLGPVKALAFIVATIASNAVAVRLAVASTDVFAVSSNLMLGTAGIVGGFVGGALLAVATGVILNMPRHRVWGAAMGLAITGAVLGGMFLPLFDFNGPGFLSELPGILFYALWHSGYAAASNRLLWTDAQFA